MEEPVSVVGAASVCVAGRSRPCSRGSRGAQITERNERGKALVVIGYVAFVVWAVVLLKVMADQVFAPEP